MTAKLRAISESTPVTLGLVLGLVGGMMVVVFWAGNKLGVMETVQLQTTASVVELREGMAALNNIVTNHESRLTLQERQTAAKPTLAPPADEHSILVRKDEP